MKRFPMGMVENNTFSMKVMFLLPLLILARDNLKGEEEVKEPDFLLTGKSDKQCFTSSDVNEKDLSIEKMA